MPIIDREAILKKISEDRERLRTLGISEDRENAYYNALSPESSDPSRDEEAFRDAIADLNLAEDEQAFVRRVLDDGDGR